MVNVTRPFSGALIVMALAAMLFTTVTGCEFNVGFTTASLSEAALCQSVDPVTRQPLLKSDAFSPYAPEIFCSVKLSNAPADTDIKAQWIYLQGEDKNVTNRTILETNGKFGGTQYISFSMELHSKRWLRGDYAIKLSLGGKEQSTLPFTIKDGVPVAGQIEKVPLDSTFQEEGFGYTINYPANWGYEKLAKYVIQFAGKEDSPAWNAAVTVLNDGTTRAGGKYASFDAMVAEFHSSTKTKDPNYKYYDEKAFMYTAAGSVQLTGRESTGEFTLQQIKYKQRAIFLPRSGGEIFHTWLYTAPIDLYNYYLPIGQAMLDSWKIAK